MAPVRGPHNESYQEFYDDWSSKQVQQLKELKEALDNNMEEAEVRELVDKAKHHYEYYYVAKDNAARQSILQVMNPSWKTPLETAFMWVGGWRPALVFQLAYALAGQHLEAELEEVLAGMNKPSMASLSTTQLVKINDMQVEAQKQEDDLSHRLAVLQQGMADQPFVGMAQASLLQLGSTLVNDPAGGFDDMEGALDEKLKQLEDLLLEADNLRKTTLCSMVDILSPVQAAQYLVAAAELQLAFRKVGLMKTDGANGAAGRVDGEDS